MTQHSYEESNRPFCAEVLAKSRNFYQQHFLFLDAMMGGPQKAIKSRKTQSAEHKPLKFGRAASRNIVTRIRLMPASAFKCQHNELPHRFWTDMLSITP